MPRKMTVLTAATELADADQFLIEQGGTNKRITADLLPLPISYIGGLITSNDTDADHDIAIAPGIARSDDDAANMKLASILTKQIDGAWAVGDAGGLDAGSVVANQLYSLWLIKRPDTGVVDVLFMRYATLVRVTTVGVNTTDDSYNDSGSGLDIFEPGQTVRVTGFTDPANNGLKVVVSSTAAKLVVAENLVTEAAGDTISIATVGPALPTDYTKKRLIAAVKTEGSANIIPYTQSGDYFTYLVLVTDVTDASITDVTYETGTLSVPPNALAFIWGLLQNLTETDDEGILTIQPIGFAESVVAGAAFIMATIAGSTFKKTGTTGTVLTDGNSQVKYAATQVAGSAIVSIRTHGFLMLSRRDP
ncbi:MAG: hypothetical protein QGD90_00220 [Candidatus Hydrogenedentes bacterium]|nr:hypothetical protein [Candidatus Hydrogenedentota bacterium]